MPYLPSAVAEHCWPAFPSSPLPGEKRKKKLKKSEKRPPSYDPVLWTKLQCSSFIPGQPQEGPTNPVRCHSSEFEAKKGSSPLLRNYPPLRFVVEGRGSSKSRGNAGNFPLLSLGSPVIWALLKMQINGNECKNPIFF